MNTHKCKRCKEKFPGPLANWEIELHEEWCKSQNTTSSFGKDVLWGIAFASPIIIAFIIHWMITR